MASALGVGGRTVARSEERSRADLAMESYADGDASAFASLYDELAPRLLRFAMRETHDRVAAEDTVQQTLLQMHCARSRFIRGAPVLPWAYAIARRLILDGRRHSAREEHYREVEAPGDAGDAGPRGEEAIDLRRREAELARDLAALPPAHREAFCLVKLDGLSVAEAAQVLGTTPGNVKVRTHRAAEALRRADARRRRSP
jgi:RNA polymerase sigma-70 factor (ECF subfamily)